MPYREEGLMGLPGASCTICGWPLADNERFISVEGKMVCSLHNKRRRSLRELEAESALSIAHARSFRVMTGMQALVDAFNHGTPPPPVPPPNNPPPNPPPGTGGGDPGTGTGGDPGTTFPPPVVLPGDTQAECGEAPEGVVPI